MKQVLNYTYRPITDDYVVPAKRMAELLRRVHDAGKEAEKKKLCQRNK